MIVAQCPERDSLYEYSVGRLSDQQYEEVSAHLESCPECQTELMKLEDDGDTLVRQLRTPIDEPFLKEPSFRAAVAGARAIPRRLFRDRTGTPSFAPRVLGEYELLEELGRGGMGRVYKARHTKLDRIVAVKILPRGRLESSQAIMRFEREMRAIGSLDHPHVVHAYDGREIEQMPVLVMEYVEGMDLAKLVRRLGHLKPEDACELVRQTALGLQYAHANGLVHRDVKPSNIMLARDGRVKLLDLGLARFYSEPLGEELTGAGQAMGTADYIAPEQAGDSRAADIRADIYSLGCTLYKLLAGRAPFSGPEYRGVHEKMNAHIHHPLPPIGQHVSQLPSGLIAAIERMLAKDPAERFATPAEVVEALSPLCDGADTAQLIEEAERAVQPNENELAAVGVVTDSTGRQPHQAAQPQRQKPWWQWPVALGILLCMLGIGFAAGVTLTIRKDGQATQIEVPEGAHASVDPAGDVTVTVPGEATSEGNVVEQLRLQNKLYERQIAELKERLANVELYRWANAEAFVEDLITMDDHDKFLAMVPSLAKQATDDVFDESVEQLLGLLVRTRLSIAPRFRQEPAPEWAEKLVTGFDYPSEETRTRAVITLRFLQELAPERMDRHAEAVVKQLIPLLSDESTRVPGEAVFALQSFGPSAEPALDALKGIMADDEDWYAPHAAVAVAAIDPSVDIGPRLIEFIEERHPSWPYAAFRLPQFVAPDRARQVLTDLYDELESEAERRPVTQALNQIPEEEPSATSEQDAVSDKYLTSAERMISRYDRDDSGDLTAGEWKSVLVDPSPADVDGNGRITAEEYARWLQNRSERG